MSLIKRIKTKGIRGSIYSVYLSRILKPILIRYLNNKYRDKSDLISDNSFLKLIKKLDGNIKSKVKLNNIVDEISGDIGKFFFIDLHAESTKTIYCSYFKEEQKKVLERAEQILAHDLKWITPNCPTFENKINWHSNFSDEREWPLDFFMDLDYSSDKRIGDVRETWELNRHQYFVTLGKAYFLTHDEKYTAEFLNQILDWIDKNPCGYGINWLHSQETALRMISWIWAFHFFSNSPIFSTDKKIILLKSLYQHAEYTYLTLSRGLVTHNHLISEICGLAIFSILFPQFKKSARWLNFSVKIFQREVLKQIWESGPSAEISTNYHLFVLDSFLQLLILCKKNNIKISQDAEERIERMIEYAMYMVKPNGEIAKVGDNDSGRAFKLSEYDWNDRRYYFSSGTVLFNRNDFKYVSRKFQEESFWLHGPDGIAEYQKIRANKPKQNSIYFENAGYAVFKSGWDINSTHLLFRGGSTAVRKNVSFSHNHADFLSFELYHNGHSFFIDPGTYLYGKDDNWRFYFRKTNSHNTISIDNSDSANVTFSRFGLPHLPLSKLNSIKLTDSYDYIDMQHSGYSHMGILHKRKLLFVKDKFLLIIDIINGNGNHIVAQNYNSGNSGINFNQEGKEYLISDIEKLNHIKIILLNSENENHTIVKGKINPIDGWYAARYGEKIPSSILRITSSVELPFVTGAVIIFNSKVDSKIDSFNFTTNNQKFNLKFGETCYSVILDELGEIDISEGNTKKK